ncbi:NADPH oxidase 4-like [Diadema antillarum]|uniref:NADPH oxidase 4-like n=1 Tax=Diadema antillarum TaxID=105358 RepID=UPI003A895915
MSCLASSKSSANSKVITTATGVHLSGRPVKRSPSKSCSARSWLRNNGPKYIFSILWILANAAVFSSVFLHYKYQPKYYYLREILGIALCLSRASAAILNLNCAALLLPVCKHLGARLRQSSLSGRTLRRWLDHYRFTHVLFAACVCVATVVHCAAHAINAIRFSQGFNANVPDVNVATFPGQNPCTVLFSTVAGITGSCMLLILLLIFVTSLPHFRRRRHNVFWFSHRAFLVFFILLVCHPLGGILKEQCNTDRHVPGCIYPDEPLAESMSLWQPEPEPEPEFDPQAEAGATNSSTICQEKPAFTSHTSRTWRFLLLPGLLYLVERAWRWLKSRRLVAIETVRFHPGDVMELRLRVENFSARPGQYILLNCPAVSHLEWHPFTITSCPSASDPTLSLHLKVCGDWTDSLQRVLKDRPCVLSGDTVSVAYPRLQVDGPLGSASEDVLRYRVSVCIAGGIGVTPFAAMLHHLQSLDGEDLCRLKLSRLYFVWICREEDHFQWFAETINSLQYKLWQMNRPDFFNLRLHVTSKRKTQQDQSDCRSAITCCHISSGRPDLAAILSDVTLCNPKTDIGVFVCGPSKLSSRVHRLCNRFNKDKVKLHFNKERFS